MLDLLDQIMLCRGYRSHPNCNVRWYTPNISTNSSGAVSDWKPQPSSKSYHSMTLNDMITIAVRILRGDTARKRLHHRSVWWRFDVQRGYFSHICIDAYTVSLGLICRMLSLVPPRELQSGRKRQVGHFFPYLQHRTGRYCFCIGNLPQGCLHGRCLDSFFLL